MYLRPASQYKKRDWDEEEEEAHSHSRRRLMSTRKRSTRRLATNAPHGPPPPQEGARPAAQDDAVAALEADRRPEPAAHDGVAAAAAGVTEVAAAVEQITATEIRLAPKTEPAAEGVGAGEAATDGRPHASVDSQPEGAARMLAEEGADEVSLESDVESSVDEPH